MARAMKTVDEAVPVPDAADVTIDHEHLARMTFGDRRLARELLELFDRQAALLIDRMAGSDPAAVAALAHTLKGSALGIGAGGVARAAEALERAMTPGERGRALDNLTRAVSAAHRTIAEMLRP
jgi:HPt (histidine-containing phosphotransfer) domain-containing protein